MIFRLILKAFGFAVLAAVALPWLWQLCTGDYFMAVTGVSMKPTYQVGDVLVVKKPTGNDLTKIGAIAVVSFAPGDSKNQYVHRVHEITDKGVVIKGDNNDASDPGLMDETRVMGTPRALLAGPAARAYVLSQNLLGRLIAASIVIPALAIPLRPRAKHRAGAPASPPSPLHARLETEHSSASHESVDSASFDSLLKLGSTK